MLSKQIIAVLAVPYLLHEVRLEKGICACANKSPPNFTCNWKKIDELFTNLFINLLIETSTDLFLKTPSNHSKNASKLRPWGCAISESVQANAAPYYLSSRSQFRLPVPGTKQITFKLALEAFERIFLRVTVINDHGNQAQMHQPGKKFSKLLHITNLAAGFIYQLLVCSPDRWQSSL